MRLRERIFQAYSILFTAGLLVAAWLGYGVGNSAAGADVRLVLLAVLWMLGIAVAYLFALWYAQPAELLKERVRERELAKDVQEIKVQDLGEFAPVAQHLNRMAQQLSSSSGPRDQLVADVAHELRTPLSILRGQVESILEGKVELVPEQLLPMLDETARLTRLVQDLQQLSLAKEGALQLAREWVPFARLLQEIVSVLELEAEGKGTKIELVASAEQEVYCDRARIKQVLINLIGNAIRYAESGGSVEVTAQFAAGEMRLTVRDDGPGIPPESLPYLFDRFYRVEGSRSRQSGGMGLGLAIAKEFVEAHGGKLRVKSELGEGTTFALNLPIFPAS